MTSKIVLICLNFTFLQMTQIYFFMHQNLSELEVLINAHLSKVFTWLSANKLSLISIKQILSFFIVLKKPPTIILNYT